MMISMHIGETEKFIMPLNGTKKYDLQDRLISYAVRIIRRAGANPSNLEIPCWKLDIERGN